MIDILTLALTHGLIAIALWRMLFRDDLDVEEGEAPTTRKPWRKKVHNGTNGAQPGA